MKPFRFVNYVAFFLPLIALGESPLGRYKSFGHDGGVLTRVSERGSTGRAVVVQQDGKILVGGQAIIGEETVIALVRYRSNGTLDRSFGAFGQVLTRIQGGSGATADLALQTDGKIIVASYSYNQSLAAGFIAIRYHPSGALDHSFGNQGLVSAALGGSIASATCLAIQTDGKILLGGQVAVGSRWIFGLVRLATSGAIDSSFGTAGSVLTDFAIGDAVPTGIAVQTDGKIVMSGSSSNGTNSDFAIARYNLNGDLDGSFGDGGIVRQVVGESFDSTATCMELDSAGRILLAGWSIPSLSPDNNMDLTISRLLPSGLPDWTFGNDSVLMVDGGQEQEAAWDMALQSDGKILVTSSANYDFSLLRLLPHGELDATFGRAGLYQFDFQGDADTSSGLALGSNGDVFVTGYATQENIPHFALWKLRPPYGRCQGHYR